MQSATQPTLSAIVLHYLDAEPTARCVEDLLAQREVELAVVIVDNASPNSSGDRLEAYFRSEPRVQLIRSPENGGYARGNNYGVRWRLARSPVDYLLIINNDVRVRDALAVAQLTRFAEAHVDAGMVGPRVETSAGFPQGPYRRPHPLLCCLRYLLPIFPLGHRLFRRLLRERASRSCYSVVGACFLVRAAAFERAGMFDEATFLGAEEYILTERLAELGLRSYYVPRARVVHWHEVSAIRQSGGEERHMPKGIASMSYYFRRYQRASGLSIRLYEAAAAFHQRYVLPGRRKLPI